VPSRIESPNDLLPAAPIANNIPQRKNQYLTPQPPASTEVTDFALETPTKSSRPSSHKRPTLSRSSLHSAQQSTSPLLRSLSFDKISALSSSPPAEEAASSSSSGGILEQAWMMKMAQEIARKVQEEKDRADRRGNGKGREARGGIWAEDGEAEAPPAYVA
jgi:distribution and morphology protein 34